MSRGATRVVVGRGGEAAVGRPARTGVLLHGYGGDREEVAELADALATRLNARVLVPDLPGHGSASATPLTLAAAQAALADLVDAADGPLDFAVGHSLGARLALQLDARAYVLLAMPGEPEFGGSARDLVRTLRPQRVVEERRFSGLVEVLSAELELPVRPALLLTPADELATGVDLARAWGDAGLECLRIEGTDHRGIVGSPDAIDAATQWLADVLA